MKKIFYIDLFRRENSNQYWLKAFKKFGETRVFDIREELDSLPSRVASFRPDHIHLGGSVKKGFISPAFLTKAREDTGCSISVFYGDARYSSYHVDLARVVDHVYINNRTHIADNESKGLTNFRYMPCATDPEIFRPMGGVKKNDLVFIGHNNSQSRLTLLEKLHGRFHLSVAGRGWEETGLNALPQAYGPEFSMLVDRAKILLGLMSDEWSRLEACFSNRLVNTLSCEGFLIQRYTPGLETLFGNHKHLVWYRTDEELYALIDAHLEKDELRRRIGRCGRDLMISKFTYDHAISRIMRRVPTFLDIRADS